jgi:hypothetical protein
VLPDIITTLYYTRKHLVFSVPPLLYLHKLHRKVHWFETEHPDGTCSYRYPNLPLLAAEALFTCWVAMVLFNNGL